MALKSIKSGTLSRGLALAKVSFGAGAKAASHAFGNLFANEEDKSERLKSFLVSQMGALSQEFGRLKGSVMKVGQMLSMYGEHFLPPEANAFLKTLQNQSPPLAWPEIEKVLKKQLGEEKLAELEIETTPLASASLGQVHVARRLSDGRKLALKIQYPGVDRAIDSDLKTLRSVLSVAKLIPTGANTDEIFKEVRQMLHQEVDYERELKTTQEFRELFADDDGVILPEVLPEYSSSRVLATSFEAGIPCDSPEVLALSQERRNALAMIFLRVYFKELFVFHRMQTDPHFGNYRVRLGENGEPDRLVLLDFGAVRKFPKSFMVPYTEMVKGAAYGDLVQLEKGARGMGMLLPDDSPELRRLFADVCYLITEPFAEGGAYDWSQGELPKRVMKKLTEIALKYKLRTPPRELVFLDRKLGGVYIFLSVWRAKIDGRPMLLTYLDRSADE